MIALNEEEEFEFRYRLEQEQEPTPQKQPGMLSKMAQGAGQALDIYGKSQFGSPQDLMGRLDTSVRSGFNKAGTFAAEQMGKEGANPNLAAGVGTFIGMAPDIASMAGPETTAKAPRPLLRGISRPMAQRSLGLTKRFLNTPFARGKAAQAADAALDQGVIPALGSPKVAMGRAVDLQEKSGQALGSMREAAGANPIDPVFDSLEAARQRATGGMRGGAWDTVHKKFDEAQETLMGLLEGGAEVPLAKVEQAKKLLAKTVNWIADNVSQDTAKQISSSIEAGVESIMRSKGINMTEYAAQKGLYGASKTMQKGLANEVAAQAGNNAVSLPTMVAGAGQLATGNPAGALATVGVVEALRRRGMGAGARGIEGIDRFGQSLRRPRTFGVPFLADEGSPTIGLIQGGAVAAQGDGPRLTDPREKLVDRPRNGFKSLFKNPKNGVKAGGRNNNGQMSQPYDDRNKNGNQNNYAGDVKGRGDQVTPKRILAERVAKGTEPRNIVSDFFEKSRNYAPSIFKPKKRLDKEQARKFLDLANGNKDLARAIARKEGYQW